MTQKLWVLVTLWLDADQKTVAEAIKKADENIVKKADPITGPYDIMVLLEGEDVNELGKFVVDKIRTIGGVHETLSSVVFPNL